MLRHEDELAARDEKLSGLRLSQVALRNLVKEA